MLAILILSLLGTVIMFLGFLGNKRILLPFTAVSCLAALVGTFYELANLQEMQAGLYASDYLNDMVGMNLYSGLFIAVILTCGLLVLPFAQSFEREHDVQLAEFCALMLFTMAGAAMMVTYQNLIMLFVGLEILSISVYVLSGSDKRNVRSNEAALKYFLMGAFATGILLFGVAMLYGATGSFYLKDMASHNLITDFDLPINLRLLGMLLVIVGILFKASAAPFHFWAPDVYEGAPTVFTAFMSTVVKTAAFAALLQFLNIAFSAEDDYHAWYTIIAGACALTLLVGNLMALVQTNFKRLMAYSAISHAGYMLIAVMSATTDSSIGILYYTLAYGLATITAFGVLIVITQKTPAEGLDPFRGLGRRQPFLAFALTVALASLSGIPLTAGFIGKFYMFTTAFSRVGTGWILVIAAITSTISMFYYFRVIVAMYMSERQNPDVLQITVGQQVALFATTAFTILLGVAPGLLAFFRF